MPTPANGIFWAALPVMVKSSNNPTLIEWFGNPLFLIVLGFISALVMVAEIPLISFLNSELPMERQRGKIPVVDCLGGITGFFSSKCVANNYCFILTFVGVI